MLHSEDQLGTRLSFNSRPERIVSLVPSQSEFLWDLGLHEELVGITKFCVRPREMFETVKRVGGTKQIDVSKITELQPDIIIGNKEENEKGQIDSIGLKYPVWMSDVGNFEDAFDMMTELGSLFGREEKAYELVHRARMSVEKSKDLFSGGGAGLLYLEGSLSVSRQRHLYPPCAGTHRF